MIGVGTFPSDVPVVAPHPAKVDYATVSDEEEEADVEDFAEPWFKYDIKGIPHAFYPICVGEVVNGRYLVEHKLGAIPLWILSYSSSGFIFGVCLGVYGVDVLCLE